MASNITDGKKSIRLIGSQRYTHDTFKISQEAYTSTLDIKDSEVYTDAASIPSSGLPYNAAGDNRSIHQVNGNNIVKYWYRQRLTKSNYNASQGSVWFFLDPYNTNAIGAQVIDSDQESNFISPKYSVASLASATTEDATPGYGIKVYKSTSTNSASLTSTSAVNPADYVFDYKTGVLQFVESTTEPASNEHVYITAYQYVGKTLATGVNTSAISASGVSVQGNISASGWISASKFVGDGSELTGVTSYTNADTKTYIDSLGVVSGSNIEFQGNANLLIKSTGKLYFNDVGGEYISGNGNILSLVGNTEIDLTATAVDINATLDVQENSNFQKNVTIAGDLTVTGDTTIIETEQVTIQDPFLRIYSGSGHESKDAGIIVQSGSDGNVGSAFYHDINSHRWAVAKTITSTGDNVNVTPEAFVSTVSQSITTNEPSTTHQGYGKGEFFMGADGELWYRDN